MQDFKKALKDEVASSLRNNYTDNIDYIRFSDKTSIKPSLKTTLSIFLRSYFPGLMNWIKPIEILPLIDLLYSENKMASEKLSGLNFLFEKLEDKLSKELLIKLIAYKILGYTKVRLPLSNKEYWEKYNEIDSQADKKDSIDPGFLDFILHKHNFKPLNIELYFTTRGVLTDFVIEQYAYKNENFIISVEEGDVVIDGGGCWGDTALYFAAKVGEKGKVYSFEFIPSNIELFKKNVGLNPIYEERVVLVGNPLWEKSNIKMYYQDRGPGSHVSFDKLLGEDTVHTKNIDDLVAEQNIKKVDFIKMDIEGAEPYALKGAIDTIKRFKPVLAIAIYHSLDDFINIPEWIDSLDLGYKFYLGHYTIHSEETILFAKI